ncbi:MAG TPA: transcription termination factor NusA [Sandaracinaceae bacterium LLY-WYZ-13_1]|nr:transcription termination factor NusA [Sandaracinaceae bacterium LLY-WYZ-13_1]
MQQGMSLQNIIEQVSREKGIDPEVLIETMKQAIVTAAKRTFGMNRDLEPQWNEETGNVDLFLFLSVVDEVEDPEQEISIEDARRYGFEDVEVNEEDPEQLGFQIFYLPEQAEEAKQQDRQYGELLGIQQARRGFGRIAAQTAKQVIIQRIRDAERELIFNEYKDRRGELITGIVRRFERGSNIIVDLGRTEAILPTREQTPRESYRPGDRIVAFLKDIDREARGPQIILSRTDVGLLVKLFEMEVPEIYEGIVRIVAAAREPGARSKIAVTSRDSDVDPVGACVGMKGSRVQAVVQELRGEKIDIVPWDRDPARFVCNAIAPTEVSRVIIDEGHAGMELVVPDAKLSLAIGRRGQNVRLASQLTGWKLDIVSETRFRQMEDAALEELARIASADEEMVKSFYKMGFRSLDEVAEAPDEELQTIEGIDSPEKAASIRQEAAEAMEAFRLERVEEAKTQVEPLTDRDHLLLARNCTDRIVEALESAGYRSPADVLRETDVDRLAIRTGLGIQKAQEVQEGVSHYVENEMDAVVEAQREVRARHEAEVAARAEAEAAEQAAQAEASGDGAEGEGEASGDGATPETSETSEESTSESASAESPAREEA